MIESPVKPPPGGGPPVAPPPDPRTRVMDPAPDRAARHGFACRQCGSPLHADQAACLACGAMVESEDERIGLRRVVAGSSAVLLLLGGAVGAAVAGLPNGKHVGKGPIAQVFGKKPVAPIPPATVTPSPRSGGGLGKSTPLAGTSKTPTKPPPIHKSATPKTSTSHTGSSSGNSGGSSSSNSGTKSKTNHHNKTHKKPSVTLFARSKGEEPSEAGVFAGGHGGSVTYVYDGRPSSYWPATKSGDGVWVQSSNPGSYSHLGIVSATPGYDATVYYTTKSGHPKSLSGWTKIRSIRSAKKKQRVPLPSAAQSASYYLLVIGSRGSVRINEIQLLF